VIGVWVVAGLLGAFAIYMTGWVKGRTYGFVEGHATASRQWRAVASRLSAECRQWEAQLDDTELELAKADKALADLNDQIPVVFLAGQVFQAERKDAGL
jgi:hypothetical protein